MSVKRYHQIVKWAKYLDWNDFRDLAHDYLSYSYDRGLDVLNEEQFNEYFVRNGLRKQFLTNLEKHGKYLRYRTGNGKDRTSVYKKVENETFDEQRYATKETIELQLLLAEIEQVINKRLKNLRGALANPGLYEVVFTMIKDGYTEDEIGAKVALSQMTIHRKATKLRGWIEYLNPNNDETT